MNEEYKALRVKQPTHTQVKVQASKANRTIEEYVQWMADTIERMGLYPPKAVSQNNTANPAQ